MATDGHDDRDDEARETYDRLALPLLIPVLVFLFAVLTIYGLSRIYLELDHYHVRTVSMATPLAIGVALLILLISTFMASQRRIQTWQVAGVFVVAASLLTSGAIWAAVHQESTAEGVVATETPTGGTPLPPGVSVTLTESPFSVTADPDSAAAGEVTFNVTNGGNIMHDFRVVKTELAVDKLPIDDSGFSVDETKVDVVGSLDEFNGGETQTLPLTLEAGAYVLFCNVPSHYESGMHAAFTVE